MNPYWIGRNSKKTRKKKLSACDKGHICISPCDKGSYSTNNRPYLTIFSTAHTKFRENIVSQILLIFLNNPNH